PPARVTTAMSGAPLASMCSATFPGASHAFCGFPGKAAMSYSGCSASLGTMGPPMPPVCESPINHTERGVVVEVVGVVGVVVDVVVGSVVVGAVVDVVMHVPSAGGLLARNSVPGPVVTSPPGPNRMLEVSP